MHQTISSLLLSLLTCFTLTLHAQVDLPYYSGFDNATERSGWEIFRTAENALANWSIPPAGGFSPVSCISHDYAPSSGAGVADDWFVSPGFLIPAGGTLDSLRYFFSGFSVPATDDTIGIFMLTGSKNPSNATSITLLADFRGGLYQADATYRLLNSIALPTTPEIAHIAIRYLNAQVSSRWLTVRFDNVAISGTTTAVEPNANDQITSIYPNPCADLLHIEHSAKAGTIVIHDHLGRAVQHATIISGSTQTTFPVQCLMSGTYYMTIEQDGKRTSRVVVKA